MSRFASLDIALSPHAVVNNIAIDYGLIMKKLACITMWQKPYIRFSIVLLTTVSISISSPELLNYLHQQISYWKDILVETSCNG